MAIYWLLTIIVLLSVNYPLLFGVELIMIIFCKYKKYNLILINANNEEVTLKKLIDDIKDTFNKINDFNKSKSINNKEKREETE